MAPSPRLLTTIGLAALVAAAGPALAAPKPKPKPITETYEATAFPPDPTPFVGPGAPLNPNTGNCQPQVPQAAHLKAFKVPAAGSIVIDLTNFQGDWALGLRNKAGKNLADSDNAVGTAIDTPEKIKYKFKGPQEVTIAACNFAGGPTGTVKYTFTYA
jgi:hypothetical protein